jgi:hypothetical protein
LDGLGWTHTAIAAEVGVSTFSVRTVVGPKRSRSAATPPADTSSGETTSGDTTSGDTVEVGSTGVAGEAATDVDASVEGGAGGVAVLPVLPVLPDPVSRKGERVLAPWGLLGEGASPVFRAGARYPLAGLLLAL